MLDKKLNNNVSADFTVDHAISENDSNKVGACQRSNKTILLILNIYSYALEFTIRYLH